jgi:alcohol dehydrogenase class IV
MVIARRKKVIKAWYKAHFAANAGSVSLSAAGLVMGFYMIQQSTGVHLRIPHAILGAVTLAAVLAQPWVGLAFRKFKKGKKQLRLVHIWMGRAAIALMLLVIVLGLLQVYVIKA